MIRKHTLAFGLLAAWTPCLVAAQQPTKLPTIGFLGSNTASMQSELTRAFVKRLDELGWVEGRNVAIEYRWAEGRSDHVPNILAELLQLQVDVLVTSTTPITLAAKQATSQIPIVFATSGDPVGTGIVTSLARPGGNATGLSIQHADIASKRVELLHEMIPGLRRLAIVAASGNPFVRLEVAEIQKAARAMDIEIIVREINRAEDLEPTIAGLKGSADALYISASPLFLTNRVLLHTLTLGAGLPTSFGFREQFEAGGLMSYGPDVSDLFRRAGNFVDKILRGTNPADLPVEQPIKFELVINLRTAKALGIQISPALLARADEVIE